uniref:Uncharacterized protein n=1 Tax=Cacopsylla melanoneura TaxID=428564 RepID=A0A8D8ZMY8_9HEMI
MREAKNSLDGRMINLSVQFGPPHTLSCIILVHSESMNEPPLKTDHFFLSLSLSGSTCYYCKILLTRFFMCKLLWTCGFYLRTKARSFNGTFGLVRSVFGGSFEYLNKNRPHFSLGVDMLKKKYPLGVQRRK